MPLTDPPEAAEVEVSIFGPGKGECVVLHLGGGRWIVVDSCIEQESREHPAIRYLSAMGVAMATDVHLIVGTHAHDDHISGIAMLYESCQSAKFVCSSALTAEEFYALIEVDQSIAAQLRKTSYSEYRRVFDEAAGRARKSGLSAIRRALEGRELLNLPAAGAAPSVLVRSLSPSDHAVTRATAVLASASVVGGARKRSVLADPNELAVALWVEVGDISVLLGADLLIGPAGCGWGAILNGFAPRRAASLVKVPHHGAPNADHPDVWEKLLAPDPVAVLAPYRAGRTRRPSDDDVSRLRGRTHHLYATARTNTPAPSKRVRRTAASLGQLASTVREPWGRCGHVRARMAPGDSQWRIDLDKPALRL